MWRTYFFAALAFATPQLAAAQQAPASEPKISFEEKAAPLARLMPRLAEATHMPLKASKAVETEVLCIYVQDVTPTELLQKIAEATGGEWQKSSDGLYLVPKEAARQVLSQRGNAARAVGLKKAIDALDPAKKKPDAKPNRTENMFGGNDDPIFYQFLTGVGADALSTIEPSARVVYSTRPTARQIAVPTDLSEALNEYIQRHNKAYNDQRAAVKAQGGGDEDQGDDAMQMDGPFGFMGNRGLIKVPPSKANFIVTRSNVFAMLSGDGLSVQMVIYDAKGKVLAQEQTQIAQTFFGMDQSELESATAAQLGQPTPQAKPSTEKPVELSIETQRFVKGLMSSMGGLGTGPDAAMSPALRKQIHEQMLAPNVNDPVSYPAELLIATAKARNLELVASLPDAFFAWFMSLFMGNATPTTILKRLDNDVKLVVDKPTGWLIVAPADFSSEPMNRDDLAKVCTTFDGKGDYSLDDLLTLAHLGFGGSGGSSAMQMWITLVSPGLMMLSYTEDWDMLRLYDALGPIQRDELQKNKGIAIGSLDDKAHDLAERLVYGSGSGFMSFMGAQLMVDRPKEADPLVGDVGGDVDNIMGEYGMDGTNPNDYRSEPTEVAPNGLPSQAMFTLSFSNQQVLKPAKNSDAPTAFSFMEQAMPVDQLADMMASAEVTRTQGQSNPGADYMAGMIQAYNKVLVGSQTHLHFRIYAGRESFKAGQAVTSSFAGSDTYTLHTLPPDIQKKFDAALKQMKEMMKDMPPSTPIPATTGGGNTGPK